MEDLEYKNYVDLAKKEIKQIEGHEIRICEYAMKVTTIRHGGRSNGFYTITDFAKDIGMSNKTLQNWLLTYRNVIMKLDVKLTTSKEFAKARATENTLRSERQNRNRMEGKPAGSRFAIKQEIPEEKVRNIFHTLNQDERPFEAEFQAMIRTIKHANNLLDKRDLRIIPDNYLSDLMQMYDQASDKINDYLTAKKKQMGRAC